MFHLKDDSKSLLLVGGCVLTEQNYPSKKKIISMFISESLYCHCINNTKKLVPPWLVRNVKEKYKAINRYLKRVDM